MAVSTTAPTKPIRLTVRAKTTIAPVIRISGRQPIRVAGGPSIAKELKSTTRPSSAVPQERIVGR
jgi:hypothetical protein